MEDSTGITIEFLRARLLAERSVSKSARQRADELTKRVAELEEQLKIVSLQRKKAEKATADVLAILEDNDISDMSDAYDSSSDQETQCESKVGNIPIKVNENYASLRVRRNGSEEFSGSDHDCSPGSGRSLSWKGRKNAQNSPEKNRDSFMKRRGSSTSCDSSSPKHRQGKSCRQIRRRDSRPVAEYHKADRIKIDLKENGAPVSPEMFPSTEDDPSLRGSSEIHLEKDLHYNPHLSCLENKRSVTSDDLNIHGQGANNDMESALEHQTQLIGRYEGMERAQREWEEKFREKNNGTPDPYDLGNHSDVTDEKDEIKTHLQQPACAIAFQEARTEVEYASISKDSVETQSRNFLHPSPDGLSLKNKKFPSNSSESVFPDAAFPITKGKQPHGNLDNNNEMNTSNSHHDSNHVPHGNRDNSSLTVETSGSQKAQNELYALVPQKASNGFDGVLEALQKARVSLQQKMAELPLVEPGSVREAENKIGIPVGCAELFRVPDFSVDTTTANFFSSGSRLNLAGSYPDTSFRLTTNQYFGTQTSSDYQLLLGTQISSPYVGTQPSSTDYLGPQVTSPDARSGFSSSTSSYPSSPYNTDAQRFQHSENVSRSSTNRLDHYSNSSLQPPPSQYPSIHAYPDLISPPPVKHGFPTFRPSVRVPPSDHFSFNNNQFTANMYR